jgi:hypothetical protein
MPAKMEALAVLLVLLPGFLFSYVIRQFSVRRDQSEFDKVVEALLFSAILYVLTLARFGYILPVSWTTTTLSNGFLAIKLSINWYFIGELSLWLAVLAVLWAVNINHDILLKLFRFVRITDRTARNSIWNYVFQDVRSSYLQVQLSDGSIVVGYLEYYSDNPEDGLLFLSDAAWLDSKGEQVPINGPGILLTKESKVVSISFLNPNIKPQSAGSETGSSQ